ncbi:MAG: hypothetical protein OHK0045_07950 [Raineya sp.]
MLSIKPFVLSAQILNDSAQNVYGANTTLRIRELDIFRNQDSLRRIDTSLANFHLFDLARKNHFLLQDLGNNLGTPAKAVFYILPTQIGVQWGIKAYDFHKIPVDSVYYYDTKSPYSDFFFVQGGRGQQIAGVEFSRNVKANFNFGFRFQRTNTFRQYALSGNRTENAILEQYNALVWARYNSPNQRYRLLWHYHHFISPLKELGGIVGGDKPEILFDHSNTQARLSNDPRSWQVYNRLRLYQELAKDSTRKIALFHSIQFEKQRDNYTDANLTNNREFYLQSAPIAVIPNDFFSPNRIQDDYKYFLLTNQIGIKTQLKKMFVWGYFKRRDFGVNSFMKEFYQPRANENFLGGGINLRLPYQAQLEVNAEYLLGKQDYLLRGTLKQPYLQASFTSMSFSPAIIENSYISRVGAWNYQNRLANTFVQELWGQLQVPLKKIHLEPSIKYQIINNHIYFRRDTTGFIFPDQARNTTIQVLQLGIAWQLQLHKYFHFEQKTLYTEDLSGSNLLRFPRWHIVSSWYYERAIFKSALFLRVGIDGHLRSQYFADAYMPVMKQFYLQDAVLMRTYPIFDVFASIRIRKTRAFVKMSHINEGLMPAPHRGYEMTPFYAGLRRTFSLGLSWKLYD